jgi:hypothetical protein
VPSSVSTHRADPRPGVSPVGTYRNALPEGPEDLNLEVELRPDGTVRTARCLFDLWCRPRTEVAVREGRWSLSGDELQLSLDGVVLRYAYDPAITVPPVSTMPALSVPGWRPLGEHPNPPIDRVSLVSSDAYSRAWRGGLVAAHASKGWEVKAGEDRIEFTRPRARPWWKFW